MTGSSEGPARRDSSGTDGHLTRRRILAGGCLALGTGGAVVESTAALFSDADTAAGAVRIDADPALNYNVVDESAFSFSAGTGARYQIQYQVAWIDPFDRLEIQVENVDDGSVAGETFTATSREGVVTYPSSGTYDDGSQGDAYRITFAAFESGASAPVLERVVTIDAGGDGAGDGEMGDEDDPKLESFSVTDNTGLFVGRYTVDYQLANATDDNFSAVAVTFDSLDFSGNPGRTNTDSSRPSGSVSYSRLGTRGNTFEIRIEVKNENGLVVDAASLTDVADGTDP